MNKYKINYNPLLIHVEEKEQTMHANYLVLSMQNAHPYFEWNRLLSYQQIFLKNKMQTRQKNSFSAWFGKFKVHFCKIIDV